MRYVRTFESHEENEEFEDLLSSFQDFGLSPSFSLNLKFKFPLMEGDYSSISDLFSGNFYVEISGIKFGRKKPFRQEILKEIAQENFSFGFQFPYLKQNFPNFYTKKKYAELASECLSRPHQEVKFQFSWPPDFGYPTHFTTCENPLVNWIEKISFWILESQWNSLNLGDSIKKSFLDFYFQRSGTDFSISYDGKELSPGSELWLTSF